MTSGENFILAFSNLRTFSAEWLIQFCTSAILIIFGSTYFRAQNPQALPLATANSLRGSGMSFTPNKGQIADMNGKPCPDVLYKGETPGADIYLRKTGISYVLSDMNQVMHEIEEEVEEKEHNGQLQQHEVEKLKQELEMQAQIQIHRLDVDFVNINQLTEIEMYEQVEGYTNYYYGHCPQGITNVYSYNTVTQKNIYKGIDVKYFGNKQNGLEYDFVVHPHADPSQIKLSYKGAESIHIDESGRLIIKTELNTITEYMPKVYQNINGKIVDIKAEYKLNKRNETSGFRTNINHTHVSVIKSCNYEVTFRLETYDHNFPLIIDPWATYYGGNISEYVEGITTDDTGNVLISGRSNDVAFPVGPGSVAQTTFGGLWDTFTVKFNAAGGRLWATFYGGDKNDGSSSVATDNAGNVLIAGYTQGGSFPLGATGANIVQQLLFGGAMDAFVVKLTPAGSRFFATFYGGDKSENATSIQTDNSGNILIAGETYGGSFPIASVGANVVQQAVFGGALDGFVVKFSPAGSRLWATFFGGNKVESDVILDVDKSDNVLITGDTYGGSFPAGAFGTNIVQQASFGGGMTDLFVAKFSPIGSRLWATFFGGSGSDFSHGIITDNDGNVAIIGNPGVSFPVGAVASNIVQQAIPTGGDVFVAKFSPIGARLWATYCGGGANFQYGSIACDADNYIYALFEGEDVASGTLIDACSWQPVFNGGSAINTNGPSRPVEDQTIVKYSPIGEKLCATYVGGTGEDELETSHGMIAIFDNSLYIAGMTDGSYPVTAGVAQTIYGGGAWDAFVVQLCINICEGKTLGVDFVGTGNCPLTLTPSIASSCDTAGYKYQWIFQGGIPVSSTEINPVVSYNSPGTYSVKLVLTTLCKKDSITKQFTVSAPCSNCNLSTLFTKGTANCVNCGCKEWLMVTGKDGTEPYSYQWPDGYNKRYRNGLCPGAYNVKVTDKNGCSVNLNLTSP
ncbi:MAG: hypothetical protein HYU69_03165 [Bacteroidetes bacterium]|nr:hypothetical protein [Bacteroidota bacterium]